MNRLPGDAELAKLYQLGVSDREIADRYGVTLQAVNKRMTRMGLYRAPISAEVSELLRTAWDIKSHAEAGSHHHQSAAQLLRAYLRRELGDEGLSARTVSMADKFIHRLDGGRLILDYDPEAGFQWRERGEDDGHLVIAWPKRVPLPTGRHLEILLLPPTTGPE